MFSRKKNSHPKNANAVLTKIGNKIFLDCVTKITVLFILTILRIIKSLGMKMTYPCALELAVSQPFHQGAL